MKRTKKDHAALVDDPGLLFPARDMSLHCNGAHVILAPNGEREIWIKSPCGRRGFAITAGDGPAGFALNVRCLVGTPNATVVGNDHDGTPFDHDGAVDIGIVQYQGDEWAQAFKRWYVDPKNEEHPGERPE